MTGHKTVNIEGIYCRAGQANWDYIVRVGHTSIHDEYGNVSITSSPFSPIMNYFNVRKIFMLDDLLDGSINKINLGVVCKIVAT